MAKIFSDFTNLYEISKTLRFELKPTDETSHYLQKNNVFGKDQQVEENYKKIKVFLDDLHRYFVIKSLENLSLNFSKIEEIYLEMMKLEKKDRKNKETEFKKEKENLRKNLVKYFDDYGEILKNSLEGQTIIDEKGKQKSLKIDGDKREILFGKNILDILSFFFPDDKELFDSFKGFTTYFTNFHESRKNFYKADGIASAIATRVIDENLVFFLKNKQVYDDFYKNGKVDFIEVEKNFDIKINELFKLENYNKLILQNGIKRFNEILGGLNGKINLTKLQAYSKYLQDKKNGIENNFKKSDFPIFKGLYKQILGEIEKEDGKFIEIENENKLITELKNFVSINNEKINDGKVLINKLCDKNEVFELDKIYISKIALNTISAKFFLHWHFITDNLPKEKNKNGKEDLKEFINLEEIKNALGKAKNESENNLFKSDYSNYENEDIFEGFLAVFKLEFETNISISNETLKKLQNMVLGLDKLDENKEKREEEIGIIKDYADSVLSLYRMMKYFALEKDKKLLRDGSLYEIDNDFYNDFDKYYNDYKIINYYNEFRNFLTKKQFSQDKIKLNFENGTLLNGWDKNKEPDNYGIILRKNGKYFLGLMKKGCNHIFKNDRNIDFKSNETEFFEKMEYKFLPDPKKMLPKVCFSNKNLDLFKPSIEISKIYENGTFKTGENFNKEDFIKIVNYYKKCLKKYPDWQVFEFHFSETKKYENLADFYKEVEKDSYNVHFRNKIGSSYINEKVKNGELYLFEIYNKDFAEGKAGKENLHTIYFKGLFEENNLKKPVLKLNGEAEIFFREKSLDEKIDKERKTKREIIENRRYTKDKILFHCPIKLNFAEHNENVNLEINNYIAENSDKIKILGIDRGEKHLAYYSLIEIDSFGNWKIKESGSLNEINNGKKDVNYYNLLDGKEQEKKEGKNKWKYDTNIKELKEGYISQIIHKITKLAIENNAIIIFEDLNMGFKRGRQKIEKQIYQKLEKALIEKLSYLVFKNKNFGEKGNYLSAIQLTSPFTTFKDMGKQTGIIFYTEASYTSTTCPKCGWRKNIYIKYKNKVSAEKDLKKFDKIYFENDNFIFEYKTSNFGKGSDEIVKLFSNRERLKNFRSEKANNQFITESVDIVNGLKGILEKVGINYKTGGNLVDEIILKGMEKIDSDKNLFQSLYYYSNLVLQIRNSKTGDNSRNGDFILCPHCDFDSRKENEIGVKNGDDNGAYNIARKGILIIDKIKKWKKDGNKKYPDLYVKLEEFEELVKN